MATTEPGKTFANCLSALAFGVIAAGLTWGAGEQTSDWFRPGTVGNAALGPMNGGVTNETLHIAMTRNAALTYGIQGAVLGLLLGVAGAMAAGTGSVGRTIGRAVVSAPIGLVFGGVLGAVAASAAFTIFLRMPDAFSGDLLPPLGAHSAVWGCIGLAGGIAYGLGRGGGSASVTRAALGGMVGAILGAALYEVGGSFVFPTARIAYPIPDTRPARLLAHAAVAVLAALGAALTMNQTARPVTSQTP